MKYIKDEFGPFLYGIFFGLVLFLFLIEVTGRHPKQAAKCIAKYHKIGVCKAIKKCGVEVPKSCYRMVD